MRHIRVHAWLTQDGGTSGAEVGRTWERRQTSLIFIMFNLKQMWTWRDLVKVADGVAGGKMAQSGKSLPQKQQRPSSDFQQSYKRPAV